jgi:heme-degrading monooxygenase HmoA
LVVVAAWAWLFGAACVGEEPAEHEPQEQTRDESLCVAETLEEDSVAVAGVGAQDGPPAWGELPPDAVVAMTYLRLQDTPEAAARFEQVSGPVNEALMASPGLMGVSIRISASCNTARTMTVWASEEAMMGFVMGEAHVAAIQSTPEVSRGGSITSTWRLGDLEQVAFDAVAEGFVAHDGPVY